MARSAGGDDGERAASPPASASHEEPGGDETNAPPDETTAESGDAPQSENAPAELLPDISSAIIARTNDFRERQGEEPLSRDAELQATAEEFAEFMAVNDKYGHRADGRTPATRAKANGYKYCVIRENIAFRRGSPLEKTSELIETFVQGWIDSPEHRENMLANYITETAVAVASNDGAAFYAVQLFGRPASLRFQVEVTNRTDQVHKLTLEQNSVSDTLELPARSRLRLKRCLPTSLTLNDAKSALTLDSAATLAIVINDNDIAALQRQDADPSPPATPAVDDR